MRFRDRVAALRRDTFALYLCARDSRVPLPARLIGVAVVAYALSPVDLIPDFIPVLGYVDDLFLVPAGLWLFRRFVPDAVFLENRARAAERAAGGGRSAKVAAVVVVLTWLAFAAVVFLAVAK